MWFNAIMCKRPKGTSASFSCSLCKSCEKNIRPVGNFLQVKYWTQGSHLNFFPICKRYIWWKSTTGHHPEQTIPTMKRGGRSIMLWEPFSSAMIDELVRVNGKVVYLPAGRIFDLRDWRVWKLKFTDSLHLIWLSFSFFSKEERPKKVSLDVQSR